MHSIKITAFSCFLLFSYASYSSAPAQQPFDPDELEILEIYLVPKKVAQDELERTTERLRSFAKEFQNKDLVKKVYQAHCATEKNWASLKNAEQYIKDGGQQEIAQGLRDEAQTFKTLCEQQNQQWVNLVDKSKGNPDQLWSIFALENRQKNIYVAQALLLRAEKEELIKEKEAIRLQHTAQINQQAAEINQLRAALQRQAPAAQPIDDVHNQTPPPPYAQ